MVTDEKKQLTQSNLFLTYFRYTVRSSKWSQTPKRGQAKGKTPPGSFSITAKQCLARAPRWDQTPALPAGLSTASAALMVPLKTLLLWKTLTAEGESQAARPLQHGLQREQGGKCCSPSFNSFEGHSAPRRFGWDDFFSSLVLQPCQMPITADLPAPCCHRYIHKTHSAMAQVVWGGTGFWLQYTDKINGIYIYMIGTTVFPILFQLGSSQQWNNFHANRHYLRGKKIEHKNVAWRNSQAFPGHEKSPEILSFHWTAG